MPSAQPSAVVGSKTLPGQDGQGDLATDGRGRIRESPTW